MEGKLLIIALVVFGFVSSTEQCNIAPSLWCTSRHTARLCNVEAQCEAYLKEQNIAKTPNVNITLYYESLCGGCRDFIKEQYYPAFQAIGGIMNVNLVPYGNAMEYPESGNQWRFVCQHGEEECIGNIIETCVLQSYQNASDFFPFIYCVETSTSYPRQAAPGCAAQHGIDYSSIEPCVDGQLGNYLEHEMALKTAALNPPHQYVPWITVNGVHTNEIQDQATSDLIGLICSTYQSSVKPDGCKTARKTTRNIWEIIRQDYRQSNIIN